MKKMRSTEASKTNRLRGGLLILTALMLSANSLFAATTNITNIGQLDNLAAFSFAIMSDNKGYGTNGTAGDNIICKKFVDWVSAKDNFCLGVGDHFTTSSSARLEFRSVMESNTYFHKNFYPIVADHDNEVPFFYSGNGSATAWGRGWVIFKFLDNFFDRPDVQFRPKQSSKVSSGGKLYSDQLVDYYAKRSHSGVNVHIVALHYGDSSAFATRTKDFMISKLTALNATKTTRDIVVVLAHSKDRFFKNAMDAKYMNQSEVDFVMQSADLVCDASVHRFWRHRDYDSKYSGKGALWINTGTLDDSSTCLGGYVDIHVFNNDPPRFTMQWIGVEGRSSRQLHVGPAKHSVPQIVDAEAVAVVKEVNGRIYPVDWSKFELGSGSVPQASCHIDTPSGNVTKNVGDTLYVKVSASDSDGVERVKIYMNNVELASDSSSPYEFNLPLPTAGTFTLMAKVKDVKGNYTTSDNTRTITVTSGTTTTTVPNVINQTQSAATTSITGAGLVVGSVSQENHATVAAGKVFSQTPGSGTTVNRGTSVNLAVSLGPQSGTTKTFTSVAAHDGYVDETSETSNVGGSKSSTLTSGTALRVGDTGARKQRRSFVSFNTASLPDNAVVTKAVLKLKRGGIVGAPTSLGSLTVDIKSTSFGFGTTEALESGDFQASASKSNVGTLSYPTANGAWATATLNADGISRINLTDHTQFRIRFTTDDDNDSADDYLGFYPGDNATAANRPVLEVTYQ